MAARRWNEGTVGHRVEAAFPGICCQFGITIVSRELVGRFLQVPFALACATEREDRCEGTDFWFWAGPAHCWLRLDLTTAMNQKHLGRKRASARQNGVVVVQLSAQVLKRAARGEVEALKMVRASLKAAIEQHLAQPAAA